MRLTSAMSNWLNWFEWVLVQPVIVHCRLINRQLEGNKPINLSCHRNESQVKSTTNPSATFQLMYRNQLSDENYLCYLIDNEEKERERKK